MPWATQGAACPAWGPQPHGRAGRRGTRGRGSAGPADGPGGRRGRGRRGSGPGSRTGRAAAGRGAAGGAAERGPVKARAPASAAAARAGGRRRGRRSRCRGRPSRAGPAGGRSPRPARARAARSRCPRRPGRPAAAGLRPRRDCRRGRCTRPARRRPAAPPCLRSPAVPRPGPGRCRSCVPLAHRLVLLRPAHPERRTDRPTLKNERASPAARTARPKKATKPFTGIVAGAPPSRQLDRRRFRCGLRHVARPPVPAVPRPTPKRARFLDIDRRSAGCPVRYNDRPAYRAQYDKPITGRAGGLSGRGRAAPR